MGLLAIFTDLWPLMMHIFISGDDSFIIQTFQFITYSDIAHVTNSADFVSCMITIGSWKPTEHHWTFSSSWVIITVTGIHASLACETCKTRGSGTDDFSCRVSFSFLPKGEQNEIVWSIWLSTCLCAKHAANYGSLGHASPGNFDFGSFIRRNLVESGNVFAQT